VINSYRLERLPFPFLSIWWKW